MPDVELGGTLTWWAAFASTSITLFFLLSSFRLKSPSKPLSRRRMQKLRTRKSQRIFEFVSQKIATVDLPLGRDRASLPACKEVLEPAYGTQEDKYVLLAALASAKNLSPKAALSGSCNEKGTPSPSLFRHLLVSASDGKSISWLDAEHRSGTLRDASTEFGKVCVRLGSRLFLLSSLGHGWEPLHIVPPFPAVQRVSLNATISTDGRLVTKAKYVVRGENELLLRVAFHRLQRKIGKTSRNFWLSPTASAGKSRT